MICIAGLYRWQEGAHFDHDYYRNQHMSLTQSLLAPLGLLRLECQQGLSIAAPQVGEIIAVSQATFASIDAAKAALLADLLHYTNLKPEITLFAVTTFPVGASPSGRHG